MAKELAMVEETSEGRIVRKYFIAVENRYREWFSFVLPRLHCIKTLFEQGNYFNYIELLMTIGCSAISSSVRKRIKKNPQEFIKENGIFYVSEQYGRTIYVNAFCRKLNAETAERRLVAASPKLIDGRV